MDNKSLLRYIKAVIRTIDGSAIEQSKKADQAMSFIEQAVRGYYDVE